MINEEKTTHNAFKSLLSNYHELIKCFKTAFSFGNKERDELIKDLLWFITYAPANYDNGVSHSGMNEGETVAYQMITEYKERAKKLNIKD